MTTDTPAAAPITAERALILLFRENAISMSDRNSFLYTILEDALSAPVAAQPAASGVDAKVLLERAARLLGEWQRKYGEHQPDWLPPAGEVRWLEDAAAYIDLTGAQPAPAAPSAEPVAWMHVQGNHFEPSLRQLDDDEKARGWEQFPLWKAAPAAQPADSAMEVLIELIAIQDLKKKHAIAAYMANTQVGQLQRDGLAECDRLSTELGRIETPAWDRARALTAASKERSKTHE